MTVLLTYNIHHGADASNRDSLDGIIRVIQQSGAHICCLQEVDRRFGKRSHFVDQAQVVADRLGMTMSFATALTKNGGEYGNAILSVWPLRQCRTITLSHAAGTEQRVAAVSDIDTPQGRLTVASVHLTVERHLTHNRKAQCTELAQFAADNGPRTVIAGDFNTESSHELQPLADTMIDARNAYWPAGHPRRLSALLGRPLGATFPTCWPYRRIDRCYVSNDLSVTHCAVRRERASDHRPLVVAVTW